MKGKQLVYLIFIVSFLFYVVYFLEKREYYYFQSGNKCITVWKQFGGQCFIINEEYMGVFSPQDNYVKTSNNNSITIIIDPTSKYDMIIVNNYGQDVAINSSNKRIDYYPFNHRSEVYHKYFKNDKFIGAPIEYLSIDIKENFVTKNDIVIE